MSLRSRIALVLFMAVALFVALDRFLYQTSFAGRVGKLDLERAKERMNRLVAAYEAELEALARINSDLQSVILASPGPASASDLAPFLHGTDPIDLVLLLDAGGKVLLHQVLDRRTREPLALRDLPTERLSPDHPLRRPVQPGFSSDGLWVTQAGTMLVDRAPVESGAADELTLVVGRFLDDGHLAAWQARSGAPVDLIPIDGHELAEEEREAVARADAWPRATIDVLDAQRLRAWSLLSDLGQNPVFLMRTESPRELAALWRNLNRYAWSSSLAIALLFPLAILLLLQWIVTGPLSRLTSHVVRIGQASDTDLRLDMPRRDEIGQLADEFNGMLEKIARFQREAMAHARQAGRSEISAGVMHNLGNALNSVSISAGVALQELTDVHVGDVRTVLDALEERRGSLDEYLARDERGRHLLPFLRAVVDELEAHARAAQGELQTLERSVESVGGILQALGAVEGPREFVERVSLAEEIDSSLDIALRSVSNGNRVVITREYEFLPELYADRQRLLDVLTHVVRNALQALESTSSAPCVHLRLRREAGPWVSIEVADNGVGIARADLQRIFAMGHTTKPGSHGLGLHLASLLADEMGGSLEAESDGPGQGATFRLRLPLRLEPGAVDDPAASAAA